MAEGTTHAMFAPDMDTEIAMFVKELEQYIPWENIFHVLHAKEDYDWNVVGVVDQAD